MTRVAIVGHEGAKFTPITRSLALEIIYNILAPYNDAVVVSGRSPLGGIDVWAEMIADDMGLEKHIYPPRTLHWSSGYKPRNLQIASDCDEAHCIVVRELPEHYDGMRFESCYHCGTLRDPHVKSGGCWTVMRAHERGASQHWHII